MTSLLEDFIPDAAKKGHIKGGVGPNGQQRPPAMPEGIIVPSPKPRKKGIMWSGKSIHVGLWAPHALEVLYHRPKEFASELPIVRGPWVRLYIAVLK